MSLTSGTRLGSYEIVAPIGAGGMGEVYRASDSHLKRSVAIKVLPASVAGDAERLARFQREAEVLAALNHPNIAAIYGLEKTADLTALVMELVEGDDLSALIARGPIELADALPLAKQIAEALEVAHEQGIIHRDLKPANIKVRADGTVKVLDFGLAKAMDPIGVSSTDPMNSPTLTGRATQMGMILGTAAYMSPEQAKGKPVDKRADIWAFGVVLYEMLTGARAFTGDDVSETLASVLKDTPDFSALPASVPARLRTLVARCLERDVRQRLRDIGEARVLLTDIKGLAAPDASAVPLKASSTPRPWARDPRSMAALAAVVVALAVAVWSFVRPAGGEGDSFPARIEVNGGGAAALSRDGHAVVFSARAPTGNGNQLYVRRLDQLTSRPIPGTENVNATDPIFSPDGRAILFIANRHAIVKAALDGTPVTLADIGDMGGGLDWSDADDIVAGTGIMQGLKGLMRGSADGGSLRELTRVDTSRGELSHQWPRILADGKTVLFTIWHGSIDRAELAAASLDNGTVVRLDIVAPRALGVVDGQLVYVQADGVAMAVPFDVAALRPTGRAIPVQDAVTTAGASGTARAFLTHAGGLLFATGQAQRRLVWVDAAGRVAPAFNDVRAFTFLRLSPDGRQAAVTIDSSNSSDIWVLDFTANALTRVTTTGQTRNPSWSPDGRRVFYLSTHGGRAEFWWQPADASGPPTKAGEPPHNPWWADVSPDGRTVIFNAMYGGAVPHGSWNLETLALEGGHDARDFIATKAAEVMGRFSPDGASVAYVSNESGREEVYVRPFPQNGARVPISQTGGRRPVWSPDGTRIFYWENRQLMAASIARQPSLRVTSRQRLFDWSYPQDFDVAKDGRLLMIDQVDDGQNLVVVPNWRTELRRLTGGGR